MVSSLDEILAIDAEIAAEKEAKQERKESANSYYPELDLLREKVGRVVALNASELLRLLQTEGEDAAQARFSRATYYRLKGILKEAGLLARSPE